MQKPFIGKSYTCDLAFIVHIGTAIKDGTIHGVQIIYYGGGEVFIEGSNKEEAEKEYNFMLEKIKNNLI